jgi:hypothetical protein
MPHSLSFSASQVISLALRKPLVQSGLQPPHIQKKIFAYTKTLPNSNGLVQLQDKIVARFALTIYPYSFGIPFECRDFDAGDLCKPMYRVFKRL